MSRLARVLAVVTGVLLVSASAAAFAERQPLAFGWWQLVGSRPLTDAQRADLAACRDPGWDGLVRVLEQDVAVDCPGAWVSTTLAADAGHLRSTWLKRVAAHPGKPARERRRAGVALLVDGEGPVPGLALLLSEPDVPEDERTALVDALADGDVDLSWADPVLREDVALRRAAAGDVDDPRLLADRLRVDAALALPDEQKAREAEADVALEAIGLGRGRLDGWLDRRARGLPLQDVPKPMLRVVANHGDVCGNHGAPACLRLVADLLDATRPVDDEDALDVPAAPVDVPGVELPRPLWEVLYDGDRGAIDAASRRFAAARAWVADVPEPERSGRLLGLVAHRRFAFTPELARAGRTGDPLLALKWRRASPWTTALAAMALAPDEARVTIESVGDGVVVRFGARAAGVGACGEPFSPPPVQGEAWPARAVLAQASVEAAGASLRRGDRAHAHALAALAERLDPLGADGVLAVVDHVMPPEGDPAGLAAGRLVVAEGSPNPTGAEDARKQRAGTWDHALVEWNAAERASCPGPLSP